jgi:hypothetical protein
MVDFGFYVAHADSFIPRGIYVWADIFDGGVVSNEHVCSNLLNISQVQCDQLC